MLGGSVPAASSRSYQPRRAVPDPRRRAAHVRGGRLHARHRIRARAREGPITATAHRARASIHYGLGNPPVRWLMLATPSPRASASTCSTRCSRTCSNCGATRSAYAIAGLAAAILSGAGIVGGILAPYVRRLFRKRTPRSVATVSSAVVLVALAFRTNSGWPSCCSRCGGSLRRRRSVHRAYLNDMIPSKQRATVLSFDSLLGSAAAWCSSRSWARGGLAATARRCSEGRSTRSRCRACCSAGRSDLRGHGGRGHALAEPSDAASDATPNAPSA